MVSKKLRKAIAFAIEAHEGQIDYDGNPHIVHSLAVMSSVPTDSLKTIAVLHDVVEDTKYTLDDIKNKIGLSDDECEILKLLTHKSNTPYVDYIIDIKDNDDAVTIKLADIRDNMSRLDCVPEPDKTRMETKYEKALKILL